MGSPRPGRVIAGLRPEAFEDGAFADPTLPRLDVHVEVVEELGADTHVLFMVAAARVDASEVHDATTDDAGLLAETGSLLETTPAFAGAIEP